MFLFNRILLGINSIIGMNSCSNDNSKTVFPSFEKVSVIGLDTIFGFESIAINNDEELSSFINLLKSDTLKNQIKESFKPDYGGYAYLFTCKEVKSLKYNLTDEKSGKVECFKWYGGKYHIIEVEFNNNVQTKNIIIYKIEKEKDKLGYKENCG